MTEYKCLSCFGTYNNVNEDGTEYFHQCPTGIEDPRNENVNKDGTIIAEGKGREEV
tara:strand:+ start:493 stop:660 length:168 start_codon:yes stop_codon:yes gene_type:complete